MMLVLIVIVLMISYSQYLSAPYTSISSNQLTSDLTMQAPSILGIVFTNKEDMVTNLLYLPPLGNSDHVCLRFDFNVNIEVTSSYKRSCYRLNSGNYMTT